MDRTLKTTILLLLLAAFLQASTAHAAEEEADITSARRVRILDPNEQEHQGTIRRYYREGLPEGFKMRMEIELTPDPSHAGKVFELPVLVVPINEEGVKHGTEQHYRPWQPLQRTIEYVEGVRHGVEHGFRRCDTNRKNYVQEETHWVDGRMHGSRKFFYVDGTVQMHAEFRDGQPIGATRSYTAAGNLVEITHYGEGQMHGERILYWPDTEISRRIIPYNMGEVEGTVKTFHQNGQLRQAMPYRNGLQHGIQQEFDAEGNLTRERYWLNGDMVPKGQFDREFDGK